MNGKSVGPAPFPVRTASWFHLGKLLVFSLIPLAAVVFTGEILLRACHFQYSDTPLGVISKPEMVSLTNFSHPPKENNVSDIVKDKHQFWIPVPFLKDRYSVKKPAGITRIAALGCSCTQGCADTKQSYPEHMEDILNTQFPNRYQVMNAGVGGYSSFQGLQNLKHSVARYKPDIVTIYFGWNDHWLAKTPDHQVKIKADWQIDLINFFEKFRTYQAYHWLIARIKKKVAGPAGSSLQMFRVPLDNYEKNLNAMVDFCQARGIRPVLITAPFEKPQFRVYWFFPFSPEILEKTHRIYNDRVRRVGALRQIPVIDLEAAFLKLEEQHPLTYFSDGIHFSPAGCRLAAGLIVQSLEASGLVNNLAKRAAS
jgi:lysophospholipase L1-like esterase